MATKNELESRIALLESRLARATAAQDAPIRQPSSAASKIAEACSEEQETFVALLMDARQRVLKTITVSLGSVAAVDVHPRDVFREAVRMNAHAMVVGHNHPSGDLEPSKADHELTRRLVAAGELLGIPVLDHVIVCGDRSLSFAATGRM